MSNPVVFFEIGCADSAATTRFYESLFDWKLSATPNGAMIDTGDGIGGQINSLGHEPHQYTLFYVRVDDVEASLQRVEELGGKRIVGPVPIPIGTFAWAADPGGNVVGLWTPAN